jgi:hypothetical protein
MRWLRDGDANTQLFHAVANGRRAKNFIGTVKVGHQVITDQLGKEQAFFSAYQSLLGRILNRDCTIDLAEIGLRSTNLAHLDGDFSEQEVWDAIKEISIDRAPGPDRFIGAFYRRAWPVIKPDVMAALWKLQQGNGKGFGKLNGALISLIAKRADAIDVGGFRPISLIHSFAKLFSKLLENRLRPHMDDLISANQSAFIRGRCLHDNFMLVRQLARKFHAMKVNGVPLKLDISRAFDSIFWSFLLEVLRHMGFSKL